MRDVAAYKWLNDLPVEDLVRERVVIDAAVADGLRRGIRPESSERFFRIQIEAAKDIQRYWFERWSESGGPARAPDLAAEVRPRLLELGAAILERSANERLQHASERFTAMVEVAGLGAARKAQLFSGLSGMRCFDNRLEQILSTGMLRIGTTGDYAPFSHTADGESYAGVDIDLAADLAAALDVTLEIVATSWPMLTADLEAGAYDVAMSGVSRTLERARVGYLSEPYYIGGKTPIARCTDQARFDSLAAIDQPGVRVIVNPGGTNEAFVDLRIQTAEKILHADNRTIFAALKNGKADVMITDSIEVALQSRLHPELCGTMEMALTYQEKGFLMPRDDELRSFVNTWLGLRRADGTVDALFAQHLGAP